MDFERAISNEILQKIPCNFLRHPLVKLDIDIFANTVYPVDAIQFFFENTDFRDVTSHGLRRENHCRSTDMHISNLVFPKLFSRFFTGSGLFNRQPVQAMSL